MAKKNKKNRPEGFDPNQRKRERIEARRQAKAEELARRRKAERRERIVRRVGILAIVLFAVWFFILRGGVPDAIAGYDVEHYSTGGSGDHVQQGVTVTYDMSPPVSGQHAEGVLPCGTHGGPLENEVMVHMLEHGAVGVVYSPTISPEDVDRIEEVVADYDTHTFSAPYEGEMETPIAVIAWANTMRLPEFDGQAVREFIDAFRAGGQAPEAFQDCPNESDDDYDGPATPAPGESPGAQTTPAPDASPTGRGRGGGGDAEETEAPE